MSANPARTNPASVPAARPFPERNWTKEDEDVSRALAEAAARGEIHAWTEEEIAEALEEDAKTIGVGPFYTHEELMREAKKLIENGGQRTIHGWKEEEIQAILDECDEEELDTDSLISHAEFMRIMRAKINGVQS